MDHHYFGIRNILALRGDPPDGQPENGNRAKDGYQFCLPADRCRSATLNEGRLPKTRAGGPLSESGRESTDFCIGAAVYPEFPDEAARESSYFKLKVDAGAEYGITDMLSSMPEAYARYLDSFAASTASGCPILPGHANLLKSQHAGPTAWPPKFRGQYARLYFKSATWRPLPEGRHASTVMRRAAASIFS